MQERWFSKISVFSKNFEGLKKKIQIIFLHLHKTGTENNPEPIPRDRQHTAHSALNRSVNPQPKETRHSYQTPTSSRKGAQQ